MMCFGVVFVLLLVLGFLELLGSLHVEWVYIKFGKFSDAFSTIHCFPPWASITHTDARSRPTPHCHAALFSSTSFSVFCLDSSYCYVFNVTNLLSTMSTLPLIPCRNCFFHIRCYSFHLWKFHLDGYLFLLTCSIFALV